MSLLLALTGGGVIPPEPPPVIPTSFAGGGGGGKRHNWELHRLFEDIFAIGIPAKELPELSAADPQGTLVAKPAAEIVRQIATRTFPEPQYRLLALSLQIRLELREKELEEEEYTIVSLLLH